MCFVGNLLLGNNVVTVIVMITCGVYFARSRNACVMPANDVGFLQRQQTETILYYCCYSRGVSRSFIPTRSSHILSQYIVKHCTTLKNQKEPPLKL